jgi:thioesterase domain-containing protein
MNPRDVEDVYPLSPAQRSMLTHALAQADADLLAERLVCTFRGPCDEAALRQAWQAAADRHPALRTAFVWEGLKQPLQVVRRRVAVPFESHDLRGLEPSARQARAAELLTAQRQRAFDPAQAPLFRVLLLRLEDALWQMVWDCHHLVTDGWSVPLVIGEVLRDQAAIRVGKSPAADRGPPLRDYVAWLLKQDQAAADDYWRCRLEGFEPPGRLPVERSGVGLDVPGERYGECRRDLSVATSAALAELAAAERLTVGTLVAGAWALLLARHFDRQDVVFGLAVSGRPPELPAIERMVGPLAGSIPLRTQPAPQAEILNWLRELHAGIADAQPFEHVPPDRAREAAGLPAAARLYESLLVVENYPLEAAAQALDAKLKLVAVEGTATAAQPLVAIAVPGRVLSLRLRHDVQRFDDKSAGRLLDRWATLLEEFAADPRRRLADVPMLPVEDAADLEAHEVRGVQLAPHSEPLRAAVDDAVANCGKARICVLDAWGQPAPVGVPGELYVDDGQQRRRLGHRARWRDDGTLEWLGRAYAPLRVRWHTIDPAEVERVLGSHPAVAEAAVVGRRSARGETQAVAYVVPRAEASTVLDAGQAALLLGQVRAHALERLPAWSVPEALVALDRLPRAADGSLNAAALPEPARTRPAELPPAVAPRDALETALAEIWSDVLGIAPVGATDEFAALGGHSVLAVSLATRIEERFGRKLPLAALLRQPTVRDLAVALRAASGAAPASALVPIRPEGDGTPLFCVHPAGGTVFCYVELARHLNGRWPVYGLQAQGLEGEAPPHGTVEEMAACYAAAIRSARPDGPYGVCGWSSGGIVAYETARQLAASGGQISLLALIDAAVPGPDQSFDERDLLPMLKLMFPAEDAAAIDRLGQLSPQEQLEYFQGRAELAQIVMVGAGAAQAKAIYEVFQANVNAVLAYRPLPYEGRLTVLRASSQATPMHAHPTLGWGHWATGTIVVLDVPGDHATLFREPAIRALTRTLERCLQATAP